MSAVDHLMNGSDFAREWKTLGFFFLLPLLGLHLFFIFLVGGTRKALVSGRLRKVEAGGRTLNWMKDSTFE